MDELGDLIARVEGATGADREIDRLIALRALKWSPPLRTGVCGPGYANRADYEWRDQGGAPVGFDVPEYTSSLGATIELALDHGFFIRSEPRFFIESESVVYYSHALRPRWDDWRPDDEWFDRGEAKHDDQVISALLALLRALHHKEQER
jgi:hypothetical protein